MAVKSRYKIPVSFDRNFFDWEIPLSTKGMSTPPIPVKVILFWLGAATGLFWIYGNTFVGSASLWLQVLFGLVWFGLAVFLGGYNKTKEMTFTKVPALIEYAPRKARQVLTRKSNDPSGFYSVANMKEMFDSGLITWSDGTYGQAYTVVGSASILVFEEDKIAILDRVDSFFRKIDTNAEFMFITTKEAQRVYRQMSNLDRMHTNLKERDPELLELMNERLDILREYVGGEFMSIHQYLVIKADSVEVLQRAHSMLSAEAEESSLMFKRVTMLDKTDSEALFRKLYVGLEK